MKKAFIVSALMGCVSLPTFANTEDSKTGLYVTGKMGASIVQMSGQQFVYSGFAEAGDNGTKNGDSHRTGVFGGGLALGYDFDSQFDIPVRAELEFMARDKANATYNIRNRVRNGVTQTRDIKNQVKLNTLMVNGYYDIKNSSDFTPFVSVGLGYAAVDFKTTRADVNNPGISESYTNTHTANNFAWSVGAGVNYAINEDWDMGLSYRYLDAGKADITTAAGDGKHTSKVKVKTNDIMFGLTYRF
ncbi:outer membrane protein [Providencia sp. PROV132]|uniref:outer membrane protein n=1 Tax=Providencia sp. PROV132 TaxID=2949842 RepID=UPI0023497409|nr:OmpW family outer membrane protein [Providencia sp. PROV132]